jgi:hypothetical protein
LAFQLPLLHPVELPSPAHPTGARFCPRVPESGDNSCSSMHPSDMVAIPPARVLCVDRREAIILTLRASNHHYYLTLIPYDY